MFYTFSLATQRISLISQTGERYKVLHKKLHISYIDQFVVPPIFNYLIGAKDVEIYTWKCSPADLSPNADDKQTKDK